MWGRKGFLGEGGLGMHDFAGDGPVHLLGACNGLVGILMIGPREGRFAAAGDTKVVYKVNSEMSALFGLFILWWGSGFQTLEPRAEV